MDRARKSVERDVASSSFSKNELLDSYRKLFNKSLEELKSRQQDIILPIKQSQIPPFDVSESNYLRKKNIVPISKKIGFIGASKRAQAIIKNLAHSGHQVIMCNHERKEKEIKWFSNKIKVKVASSILELIEAADIIFNCLLPEKAGANAQDFICAVLAHVQPPKTFVEMTRMPYNRSIIIAKAIKNLGGLYLEAQICGSTVHASQGLLYISAAGDKQVYEECQSCFDAISEEHFFISDSYGSAVCRNSVMTAVLGNAYQALLETGIIILDPVDYKLLKAVSELDFMPKYDILIMLKDLIIEKTSAMVSKILEMHDL